MAKKKVARTVGGDVTNVTCTCSPPLPTDPPGTPPGPCRITAYGKLTPPDPSLGNTDLDPTCQLRWKVFEVGGGFLGQGDAVVNTALEWSASFDDSGIMSGKTYRFHIEPVWMIRQMVPTDENTTC